LNGYGGSLTPWGIETPREFGKYFFIRLRRNTLRLATGMISLRQGYGVADDGKVDAP